MTNSDSSQKDGILAWWKALWKKKETEERNQTERLNEQREASKVYLDHAALQRAVADNMTHYSEQVHKEFKTREDYGGAYCNEINGWLKDVKEHVNDYARKLSDLNENINTYVEENTGRLPDRMLESRPRKEEELIASFNLEMANEYRNLASDIWRFKNYQSQAQREKGRYMNFVTANPDLSRVAEAEGTHLKKVRDYQESILTLEGTIFPKVVTHEDFDKDTSRTSIQTASKENGLVSSRLLQSVWLGVTLFIVATMEFVINGATIMPILGRGAYFTVAYYSLMFLVVCWLVALLVAGTEKTEFWPFSYKKKAQKAQDNNKEQRLKEQCQLAVFVVAWVLCYIIYCQQVNEINLAVLENIKAAGEVLPPVPPFLMGPFTARLGEASASNQALSWLINLVIMPLSAVSFFNFLIPPTPWVYEPEFFNLKNSHICEHVSTKFIEWRLLTFERHMQDYLLKWYELNTVSIDKITEANLRKLYSIKRQVLDGWRREFESKIAYICKTCRNYSSALLQWDKRLQPLLTPPAPLIPHTCNTHENLLNYLEVTDVPTYDTRVQDFLKQTYPMTDEKRTLKQTEETNWLGRHKEALQQNVEVLNIIKSRTELLPALNRLIVEENIFIKSFINLIQKADALGTGGKRPDKEVLEFVKNDRPMHEKCGKILASYIHPATADLKLDAMLNSISIKYKEVFPKSIEDAFKSARDKKAFTPAEFQDQITKFNSPPGESEVEIINTIKPLEQQDLKKV